MEGSALLSLHCGCSCNRGKTHIILQYIEDLPPFLGPAGYQVCLGLCFTFGLKHPMASCQERILSALTFITASVLHPSSFIILYIPGGMARVSHGRRKSWAAGAILILVQKAGGPWPWQSLCWGHQHPLPAGRAHTSLPQQAPYKRAFPPKSSHGVCIPSLQRFSPPRHYQHIHASKQTKAQGARRVSQVTQ